jgi:hypothetical protein
MREGASPPLKFSPLFEHNKIRTLKTILFERKINRVSKAIYPIYPE